MRCLPRPFVEPLPQLNDPITVGGEVCWVLLEPVVGQRTQRNRRGYLAGTQPTHRAKPQTTIKTFAAISAKFRNRPAPPNIREVLADSRRRDVIKIFISRCSIEPAINCRPITVEAIAR